jgi:hypothetical protein
MLCAGSLLAPACKGKPSGSPPDPLPSRFPGLGSAAEVAPQAGIACGDLGCRQFEKPVFAFQEAIAAGGDVRVVSIGEAHAPKGAQVPSSAKRFTQEILPSLAGRASDLVVELMMPPTGCAARVAEVKKTQAPITTRQAPDDQNEYLAMGDAAKKLGIVPDLLRPTCADLDAIEDAGDDAVDASLRLIERLTREKVEKLVARDLRTPGDERKMVVTYGGAIHNDRDPPPERRAWSFGPAFDHLTEGHYVEVDLYVPEFIDRSEAWKRLPWFSSYDPVRLGEKTTLFRVRERSFAILFPGAPASSAGPF